jgi:small-conductance mechanosensitive channel
MVSSVALGAVVFGLAVIAHVALWRWGRALVRREEAKTSPRAGAVQARRPWVSLALHAAAAPVLCLVWIQGVYAAARLFLPLGADAALDLWRTSAQWAYALAVLGCLIWLLARLGRLLDEFVTWHASRTHTTWDDMVLPLAGTLARRGLPLLALMLGAPVLGVSTALQGFVGRATSVALIAVVATVVFRFVDLAAGLVIRRHPVDLRDNLQARSIHTQVLVLKKIAMTVVAIFAIGSTLMVFDSVRQFGASILASAGIAGIIVGLAAQRSIGTLLAGIQIAFTQPIRVDDVVIVENEWGKVEDITLTYVVVRIWDERRLVLPVSYFIERPFQNWTRSTSDLLATVFLHVDYTAPIEALRAELTRVLQASALWDGRVNVLQVTDARERTLEIRALASAADSSRAWDLRCEVREKLVGYLRRTCPDALPRTRAVIVGEVASSAPESVTGSTASSAV